MSKIIEQLAPLVIDKKNAIDEWFELGYARTAPFFYTSVDIRHSGHKIAPVDTNLFPAGFNNLSEQGIKRAIEATKHFIKEHYPETKQVLVIPEGHTRNLYYLDNIAALVNILEQAGLVVTLAGLNNTETLALESASKKQLTIHTITKSDNHISANDISPDLILVNNDLTSGAPELLQDLEQPVLPPVGLGWYRRRKTTHFDTYAHVVQDFSYNFDIDPWLISTVYHRCGSINFKERQGLECVALGVEKVLHTLRKKYEDYGIKDKPYVFIKANSGTYGMGIMTVNSGDEVMEINKKERKKMTVIKEGTANTEVIIQEGIPTIDTVDSKPAEPMMYLIGKQAIGCSYRVNENRDAYSNLNAPGMSFEHACEGDAEKTGAAELCPVQSLIARLATLAASRECYEAGWVI